MSSSRAHVRKQKRHVLRGTIAALGTLAILGLAVYYLITREGSPDKVTLCPMKGPTGHLVLVVDTTDPLNFTQAQAFTTLVEELIDSQIAPGELLSVFVLGEDHTQTAAPVFEKCNPGKGEGKSGLTDNISRLQKQFKESFQGPLLALVPKLQATVSAKSSPIFEMIQIASINGFRKHPIEGRRRLVIVSDMLHNTPQFSMYGGHDDYQKFRSSVYGQKMQSDLKGAETELHYIMNTPQLQTRRHLKFWEDYFLNAGARLVAVRPMEG
jgi:hypothetical protein